MELRELQYFVTIVQEGNISKAAKILNISQPPLSHAIKLLEEELNTTLFIRGSRNITLTESGKLLYSKAMNLLELQKQSIKEINDLERSVKGNISFGCVSSVHMLLMEKGIVPFNKKNPQVTYELYEKNTYELIELLNANVIDFALIRTPFASHNFEVKEIQEEPLVAVYHKDYYRFDSKKVSLKQLNEHQLIFYRRFYSILDSIFQKQFLIPRISLQCDDARSAILWASHGIGVTIVPFSATKYIIDSNVEYVFIKDIEITSKIALVYKKGHYLSKVALELIETILQK